MGPVLPPEALVTPLARQFVEHVQRRGDGAFELGDCRRIGTLECVEFIAHLPLPQDRLYDFRYDEPLLLLFDTEGTTLPALISRRMDFPRAPHMNIVKRGGWRWICLFGEHPNEVRRVLTAHLLATRILWWFTENAKGTLHRADQAIEPFLMGNVRPIYFPVEAFDGKPGRLLYIFGAHMGTDKEVLVADNEDSVPPELRGNPIGLYLFDLPLQTAGVIYEEPDSLADLHRLCQEANFDLLAELEGRLLETAMEGTHLSATILLLRIPKGREAAAPPEITEYRAFRVAQNSTDGLNDMSPAALASALGLGVLQNGRFLPLINTHVTAQEAGKLPVSMLAPIPLTTREQAALMNGADKPSEAKIVAVGMGALGSQVFAPLVRRGFGQWWLVEPDQFEPHNFARHHVLGRRYGFHKAVEMARLANETFKGPAVATPIVADVIEPGDKAKEIAHHAKDADLILDMSASTAVARHIVRKLESDAQRISLFLSPSGRDLIVLAEGRRRDVLLDGLESQYLRAVLQEPALRGLLSKPDGDLRYGPGCRDRSATLANELITMYGALGALAVQQLIKSDHPRIWVWRYDDEVLSPARIAVDVQRGFEQRLETWSIVYDEGFIERLHRLRADKLPVETCGVLLGQIDSAQHRLYVIDALPAPPDSEESADGCRRGIEGLQDALLSIRRQTGGDVDYIGEWHSHPDAAACTPSTRDFAQMLWIEERMHPVGFPALMWIVCQSDQHTILFSRPGSERQQFPAG